jgi:hypothetical protein
MGIQQRLSMRLERFAGNLLQAKKQEIEHVHDARPKHASEVSQLEHVREELTASNALDARGVKVVQAVVNAMQALFKDGAEATDGFSTGKAPGISLVDYLHRVARYINVWRGHAGGVESAGVRAVVISLIYMQRLHTRGYLINHNNVHRLAMTGALLGIKETEDYPIRNDFWCKVVGVPAKEACALEVAFCSMLKFELFVSDSLYARTLDVNDLPAF